MFACPQLCVYVQRYLHAGSYKCVYVRVCASMSLCVCMCVCVELTSLARSREALAALTFRVSRPMSHAMDLVFSQSSLYLIWNHSMVYHLFHIIECVCVCERSPQVCVHVLSVARSECVCARVLVCVHEHHCTAQRWPWLLRSGAGPGIRCIGSWSSHNLICSSATVLEHTHTHTGSQSVA